MGDRGRPGGAFKSIAGLAIGLTITIDVLMGGPLTGAAMNPARAFGPELVGDFWGEGWIYWLGPIIGALIAALAYEYLYLRPTRRPSSARPSPASTSRGPATPRSTRSSRRSAAQRVSSWRDESCSLRSTADTCDSTVRGDRCSRAAISL